MSKLPVCTEDVNNLIEAIEDLGNPFQDDNKDLCNIDTKVVVNETGMQAVRNAFDIGQRQFESFVDHNLTKKKLFMIL